MRYKQDETGRENSPYVAGTAPTGVFGRFNARLDKALLKMDSMEDNGQFYDVLKGIMADLIEFVSVIRDYARGSYREIPFFTLNALLSIAVLFALDLIFSHVWPFYAIGAQISTVASAIPGAQYLAILYYPLYLIIVFLFVFSIHFDLAIHRDWRRPSMGQIFSRRLQRMLGIDRINKSIYEAMNTNEQEDGRAQDGQRNTASSIRNLKARLRKKINRDR